MLSLKNIVGAASVAAFTLVGASAAQALTITPTFVADFGNTSTSTFIATDFGDLDDGDFAFGPIVYDESTNPNGRVLGTTSKATAQAASGPSFANGFTFNARTASNFFNWSAQIVDSNPVGSASKAGFLGFEVSFFDVSGAGSFSGGFAGFTQGELAGAVKISDNVLTDLTTGIVTFDQILDLPFGQGGVTPDAQILAIVSGKAFSDTASDPAYTIGVQAIPLPAPLVLFVSALIGLGFLGRRRTNV